MWKLCSFQRRGSREVNNTADDGAENLNNQKHQISPDYCCRVCKQTLSPSESLAGVHVCRGDTTTDDSSMDDDGGSDEHKPSPEAVRAQAQRGPPAAAARDPSPKGAMTPATASSFTELQLDGAENKTDSGLIPTTTLMDLDLLRDTNAEIARLHQEKRQLEVQLELVNLRLETASARVQLFRQ